MSKFSGAILAAGRGERLRDASNGVPKPLVELGGETLLARQARLLFEAGAYPVIAIVNSETARLIDEQRVKLPHELQLTVRDTLNSMETMLTLREHLTPGWFAAATVDAVVEPGEFKMFFERAAEVAACAGTAQFDGALGVVKWRGDKRPLFTQLDSKGVITGLGGDETALVTAGVYFFSTRIFDFSEQARGAGLTALRMFLGYLIGNGMRFAAIRLENVVDVDEAADLKQARALLKHTSDVSRPA